MNYQTYSHNHRHNIMTPEQFNEITEAITNGRYSWACVLILRYIGYNPIHYIPQRTYSRLIQKNRLLITNTSHQNINNSDHYPDLSSLN
ncbi:HetP family heterocyst commitment protein [Anabaena sp. FACHB-1237]|uniref:HetP family heterocyst commitment protein n=1 Tax=Anabaena sp. FACHB-1237 TaxID=2692769 RepID=UPI0016809732|nr:HetP family heterocyst commitment protein [Anabaena sp. FACHB-1237]MBD2136772.1 HetP family heterocyst commitment protein [Anabaena sp. FACHB-1237]